MDDWKPDRLLRALETALTFVIPWLAAVPERGV